LGPIRAWLDGTAPAGFLKIRIHGIDRVGNIVVSGRLEGVVICGQFNYRRGVGDGLGGFLNSHRFRCFSILLTTSGSSINATTRIFPWHLGQVRGSTS